MASQSWVSQRRSYNDDLCTIRYVGKVEGTSGEWLGVEWDDPTRGKHSGQHQGVNYFTCLRKHPTAGSFVRPSRPTDSSRGFLDALRGKYASEFEQTLARQAGPPEDADKPIQFNGGKVAEEVGFDKIRKQLAELEELKVVLLDGLRVAGVLAREASAGSDQSHIEEGRMEIEKTCPKIMELDLGRNLFTSWRDVADICGPLRRLRLLKLNGNRFDPVEEGLRFDGIGELHLDDTLLSWEEISAVASRFPSLTSLLVSANQISVISTPISSTINSLVLDHNEITSLSAVKTLTSLENLNHLSIRGNSIDIISKPGSDEAFQFSTNLHSVDLSLNKINSWSFIDKLSTIFPNIQTLRISGNPLFNQPVAPSSVTGLPEKPMTIDEAYMLTLARIPTLQVLNYSKISEKDRSNAELYYLSLVGKQLSASPESAEAEILATHLRYGDLCRLHGEPLLKRAMNPTGLDATIHLRSVAARLVRIVFHLNQKNDSSHPGPSPNPKSNERVKVKEIPRSFNVYQVKTIVSRLFDLTPFEFRLIWETDELDPVSKENMDIEDEWDSEDDEAESSDVLLVNDAKFVKREVELEDTTKDIGFWFQADVGEVKVRIEP
ncbi:hypothetical protein BJX99DRAFT_229687 [Aspergillus californicus]